MKLNVCRLSLLSLVMYCYQKHVLGLNGRKNSIDTEKQLSIKTFGDLEFNKGESTCPGSWGIERPKEVVLREQQGAFF